MSISLWIKHFITEKQDIADGIKQEQAEIEITSITGSKKNYYENIIRNKRPTTSIWIEKKQVKLNLALVMPKPLIELQKPEKAAGQSFVKTVETQTEKQSKKLEKYEKMN